MHFIDLFLDLRHACAQVQTFQARCDFLLLLQIIPKNLRLARQFADGGHGTKGRGSPVRVDEHRIAHGFERGSIRLRVADT